MKKLIVLILSLTFVLTLAGCGKTTGSGDPVAGGTDMPSVEKNEAIQTEETQQAGTEEKWDLIPMVMINGTMYLDTGHNSTTEARCGVMDGEITSKVDGSEKPTVDNQSNFGTGYGYQYGAAEGTIEIYMNDKWRIFATEEVRHQIQFPNKETEETTGTGAELMVDPVAPVTIKNIFTGEEALLTVNEDIRVISDILLLSDVWNADATADCLNNIEITLNGETYMYHSDCGTFNDHVNQKYLSLDDATAEKVDAILAEYISLTSEVIGK